MVQLGAEKEYGMSEPTFEKLLPEYQKFMGLVALGHRGLGMFSSEVDKIWHAHILNTALYEQFCNMICGRIIHHAPNLYGHKTTYQAEEADCIEPGPSCKEPEPGPSCEQDPGPSCSSSYEPVAASSTISHFRSVYEAEYGSIPCDIWNLSLPDSCQVANSL